eukprot:Gb_00762 [translate_table: standard]
MSHIFRLSSSLSKPILSSIKSLHSPGNPTFPLRGLHPISAPTNYFITTARNSRFSTSNSAVGAADWTNKWPVDESNLEDQHKEHGTYITVKAYLFGTSIDLKGLQSEHIFNIVPPSSRSANYVILRCADDIRDSSSNAMRYVSHLS